MKKIFRQVHLWLSVPFGLIITLVCFSGAMLLLEDEAMELTHSDLYYVKESNAPPIPVGSLLEKVSRTLPDSVSVTGVSIYPDPERSYRVSLSHPRRASVYVDQYTGEVKGKHERSPFFMTMFRLHRWLLDSAGTDGEIFWGKMLVGTSTLFLVFALFSGLVLWWPRTGRILKNSLTISTSRGSGRFWHDLHVAGGVYTLVFLLAMALTGLTWSFGWYRTAFYSLFGVETARTDNSRNIKKTDSASSNIPSYTCWQRVYERLVEMNPDYAQISLSDASANVSLRGYGNRRASNSYNFDPRNGEITRAVLYKDADKKGKIRGWIYSVHVGSWGGCFTRVLSFIAAMIGACLPLTGYYLWFKRIRKGHKRPS